MIEDAATPAAAISAAVAVTVAVAVAVAIVDASADTAGIKKNIIFSPWAYARSLLIVFQKLFLKTAVFRTILYILYFY